MAIPKQNLNHPNNSFESKVHRNSIPEIELKILRDSLPQANTLEESQGTNSECIDPDQVAEHELHNVKKAIRFLNEIRLVKNERKPKAAAESEDKAHDATYSDFEKQFDAKMPSNIGRFETVSLLGQGGFAKVFLCRDTNLNRLVAIKVPKPHALVSYESQQRFQREAHAAAKLSHPAIVPVFENEVAGPITFIVSAYCEGITMAEWIFDHREQITPRLAATIVNRLAEAVEHAHQRGVIHRDLKPGNILVESDFSHNPINTFHDPLDSHHPLDIAHRVRITDFGLAKYTQDHQQAYLTADGAVLGTPAYMSPEQARGERTVGTAADIYSLGTILYELLTGDIPFKRSSNVATLRAIEEESPPPLRKLKAGIHRNLEAICLKCLQKEPARRYASAHALHRDLTLWLDGRPVVARHPSALERFNGWYHRNPGLAAALAFAFLSLMLGLSASVWQRSRAQSNILISNEQRERAERHVSALRGTIDEALDDYVIMLEANEKLNERQLNMLSRMLVAQNELIDQETEQLDITAANLSAYAKLARLYLKIGQQEKARTICRQARRLWEIVEPEAQKKSLQPVLADVGFEAALIEVHVGNHQLAKSLLQDAVQLLNSCQDQPNVDQLQARLFKLNRHLGSEFAQELAFTEAGSYYSQAMEIATARLARNPDDQGCKKDYADALDDLAENAKLLRHHVGLAN